MARKAAVKPKRPAKPRLTDTERHQRFVDMAHEVEADEQPGAFDKAFLTVTRSPKGGKPDVN